VQRLYTTREAADLANIWRFIASGGRAATIKPSAVRTWVNRGHLKHASTNNHGHPLYAHGDLARAELATRARALRLVGIGSPRT